MGKKNRKSDAGYVGRVLQGRGLPIHQYSRGAPYTVEADDKRRVRLNRICYLLDPIPYKHVIPGKIKRPKRKEQGEYQRPPQSNLHCGAEKY